MVKIISEIGYCFGVSKAIEILNKAYKENYKVFLTHPLLHNIKENEKLMKENNAFYLDENENNLSKKNGLLFSAHGYSFLDYEKYKDKFNLYIGTCPLILNRYKQLIHYNKNITYLFIGKKNHQETISFLNNFSFLNFIDVNSDLQNQLDKIDINKKEVFIIPQTTISITTFNDFCDLVKKKTKLIKTISVCELYLKRIKDVDKYLSNKDNKNTILIIVGDKLSSNANEIKNFINKKYKNIETYIENDFDNIKKLNISNKNIYLTSATSTSKNSVILLKDKIESYLSSFK